MCRLNVTHPCIGVTDRATQTLINWYGGGMAWEQRDMTGSLFKNDKKESEKHPNAKGSCMIDGVEYWMDAWTKKDKNGNPWQSVSFKRKDKQAGPKRAPAVDEDDAAPF
jgi:hypothetical protein